MSVIRTLIKAPLRACVGWAPLRRRTIFELQQHYYADLTNRVPLGGGLVCPLLFPEAWDSFAEIFVRGEYAVAFNEIPLPDRWIDLGCHAGFFSLYVAWRRALADAHELGDALLVDADTRMSAVVAELIRLNGLADNFRFAHGMIAVGNGSERFRERAFMASSAAETGAVDGSVKEVRVLTANHISALLSPPYDLVKVDIEGAEHDFVTGYDRVLAATRAVLLEWHSWNAGTMVPQKLSSELRRKNFRLMRELSAPRTVNVGGSVCHTGLLLFARRANDL